MEQSPAATQPSQQQQQPHMPPPGKVKWTFNKTSRVLLADFTLVDKISEQEKAAVAEAMQCHDKTFVSQGLFPHFTFYEKILQNLQYAYGNSTCILCQKYG